MLKKHLPSASLKITSSFFSKFSKVFFKIVPNIYFFILKTFLSVFRARNTFKKHFQTGSNNKSKQNEWNKENIYAQAIKKKFQYKTLLRWTPRMFAYARIPFLSWHLIQWKLSTYRCKSDNFQLIKNSLKG